MFDKFQGGRIGRRCVIVIANLDNLGSGRLRLGRCERELFSF